MGRGGFSWPHHLVDVPEKPIAGVPASDCWAVPLCKHHMELATGMGRPFWSLAAGVDPLVIAARLWAQRGVRRG